MLPRAVSARHGLPGEHANAFDHVADGAHTPEFLRLEPAPRQLLQLHDKIDGVDAVDVEILVEARLRHNLRGSHIKQLAKADGEMLQDLLTRQHARLHPAATARIAPGIVY